MYLLLFSILLSGLLAVAMGIYLGKKMADIYPLPVPKRFDKKVYRLGFIVIFFLIYENLSRVYLQPDISGLTAYYLARIFLIFLVPGFILGYLSMPLRD